MKKVNIGGDRLGSGAKMETTLHGYERSNHDLSYMWKSTMSAGTLVPFMVQVGLPGDTFDIELDSIVKTHPTIGPLFGSFKLQLDVFTVPMRLYQRVLHNNKLGIGMNMASVKLPQMLLTGPNLEEAEGSEDTPVEFQQINQSSIFAYLGIRGLGSRHQTLDGISATYNAIPFLGYWDIVKNYYANKQEDTAYVIHGTIPSISSVKVNNGALPQTVTNAESCIIDVEGDNITADNIRIITSVGTFYLAAIARDWYNSIETIVEGKHLRVTGVKDFMETKNVTGSAIALQRSNQKPQIFGFTLENIDTMRETILGAPTNVPYTIGTESLAPYSLPILEIQEGTFAMYSIFSQEGLALKTYQSDLFNNWIQTEWIEGAGSISAITAISTAGDSFTIDTLNLSKKVYDMLNRIAVSGGSYEDYIEAVYDHNSKWRAETPVYQGGLSKEIVFQEVISQAASEGDPLGTLAGKGVMSSKHKGGKIIINVDEPCFIMGIVSITPRIDYSQGNEWYTTELKTLDDLHKPALDGIGYQDLITEQMAFFDTEYGETGRITKSAGKQPAWINYMTNYNRAYGNFANPQQQMFMTLNRRYEYEAPAGETPGIKDLTTYIDPSKYNYAFAQTDLSAQNFWVQIAVDQNARRKISSKIIPNL